MTSPGPSSHTATVVRVHGGFVFVDLDDDAARKANGEALRCTLRGKLKQEIRDSSLCVIGDRVGVSPVSEGTWRVDELHPRRSVFSRRQPGVGKPREDVLVANLDQLFVTVSFSTPTFRDTLLDRFLAVAEQNNIEAVVVANKCESPDVDVWQRLQFYEGLGYEVIPTSSLTGEGIDRLRARLDERISGFCGPSGVGKSSLMNRLLPGLNARVGELREQTQKGKHTTRVASLHRIDTGGFLADTPGIRELATWQLNASTLSRCFVEFTPFLDTCSFRTCTHDHEPGCEVRAALARGELRTERYDSYLRLLEETASASR